jgi:hypothetical protein
VVREAHLQPGLDRGVGGSGPEEEGVATEAASESVLDRRSWLSEACTAVRRVWKAGRDDQSWAWSCGSSSTSETATDFKLPSGLPAGVALRQSANHA